MLAGIALIGVVTASIASWLIARVRETEVDTQTELGEKIEALHREVLGLTSLLQSLGQPIPPTEVGHIPADR